MICLVTPCIVKLPVTSNLSLPAAFTDLLLKVISGYFSTSKKSGVRRCLSRSATPVSMLVALILKSTDDFARFCGSRLMVPPKSLKRPRTLVTRWRTWNDTSEWPLSTV